MATPSRALALRSGPPSKARGSERLTQIYGRNVQRLPVLRDRAPGDHDPLLPEDLGNLAVRERPLRVLGCDQLLDERADGRGGARATGLRRDVAAEEILELEDASRRQHEFLGRDARHR